MRRDKLDAVFSEVVRESFDWTCAWCGKKYTPPTLALHCSHLFSRRHKSVRCSSINAVAHCFACHQKYGGNPIEGGSWARKFLGETTYEILIAKKNKVVKWNKTLKDELYAHWKSELARLKALRAKGVTGFIRLVDYD